MGSMAFKMGDANSKVVLQYPGGKYTARKILETYIPKETKTLSCTDRNSYCAVRGKSQSG